MSRAAISASAASTTVSALPGTTGTPAAAMSRRASVLSPIALIASGEGPMNTRPARRPRLGEPPVLGEEAVAGMHRVGATLARGFEDALDVEIALARRRRADRHGPVGVTHVERVVVRLRVHRDRLDAELAAGADHAPRDLSPVGDQDRPDQRRGRAGRALSPRPPPKAGARPHPQPR